MEGVEFLDSTGLGVLVGGLKRVRAHDGTLRWSARRSGSSRSSGSPADKVFPIHATVEEAIAGGGSAPGGTHGDPQAG